MSRADATGEVWDRTRWRLVLTAPPDARPHAYLYDVDAGPYTAPRWEFDLVPDQELPRIEPGACVDVVGAVARDERPSIIAGEVTITPRNGLHASSSDRFFVARGDVVAHPGIVGPQPGWRFVRTHSFDPIDAWERFVRHAVHDTIAWIVATAVFVLGLTTAIVVNALHGGGGAGARGDAGAVADGVALVALLLSTVQTRRAFRLARRLRNAPADPMEMRLWWSAGDGHGPIAIASLFTVPGGAEIARVPVVGVSPTADHDDREPVRVRGLAAGAPLIESDGDVLWPAGPAEYATPAGWKRRRLPRRLAR